MRRPKRHLICVDWEDSASCGGWQNPLDEDISPMKVCTTGWLVKRTKTALTISATLSETGDCVDPISIPKACVRRVTKLKDPHGERDER